MPASTENQLKRSKRLIFACALLPGLYLAYAIWQEMLGPEPVEFVQRWTGSWTAGLLLLTLSISPLRNLTGRHDLLRLRRMLGLFCFFYASLHLLAFIGFEHEFSVDAIARGILKRPFVLLGFSAFAILASLAATSNAAAIRRLGGRRWQTWHRNIYLAAILGGAHFLWLAKGWHVAGALTYSLLLVALLGWRIRERQNRSTPTTPASNVRPLKFFPRRPD